MSTRQWSLGRGGSLRPGDTVGMCALVAPGPQNEIEELPRAGRQENKAGGPGQGLTGSQEPRMASRSPEVWMEAQIHC